MGLLVVALNFAALWGALALAAPVLARPAPTAETALPHLLVLLTAGVAGVLIVACWQALRTSPRSLPAVGVVAMMAYVAPLLAELTHDSLALPRWWLAPYLAATLLVGCVVCAHSYVPLGSSAADDDGKPPVDVSYGYPSAQDDP